MPTEHYQNLHLLNMTLQRKFLKNAKKVSVGRYWDIKLYSLNRRFVLFTEMQLSSNSINCSWLYLCFLLVWYVRMGVAIIRLRGFPSVHSILPFLKTSTLLRKGRACLWNIIVSCGHVWMELPQSLTWTFQALYFRSSVYSQTLRKLIICWWMSESYETNLWEEKENLSKINLSFVIVSCSFVNAFIFSFVSIFILKFTA